MTARAQWAGAVAGMSMAFALTSPAKAQDATLVKKLAPEIAKFCRAGQEGGVISASDLARAITASDVATLKTDYPAPAAEDLARQAFAVPDPTGRNAAALVLLRTLVRGWVDPASPLGRRMLPLDAGGVSVRNPDGAPATDRQGESVLAAILGGSDSAYRFGCRTPSPDGISGRDDGAGGGERASAGPAFGIVEDPDDLGQDKLTDKGFAEFAYLDDREGDSRTYSANATFGLTWPERLYDNARWRATATGLVVRTRPSVFVQYEREGSDTTVDTDEINNLNIGLQTAGFLQTNYGVTRTHYFALNARYLTDDQFESRGWSLLATVTPGLNLPGFDLPVSLADDRAELRWLLSFVADYEAIDDPGDKAALQSSPEFGRIGLDVESQLRIFVDDAREQAFSLNAGYSVREAFGGEEGDAEMFFAKVLFEPTDNYSFGLVYEHGSKLDTFEAVDQWRLTLGFRR